YGDTVVQADRHIGRETQLVVFGHLEHRLRFETMELKRQCDGIRLNVQREPTDRPAGDTFWLELQVVGAPYADSRVDFYVPRKRRNKLNSETGRGLRGRLFQRDRPFAPGG